MELYWKDSVLKASPSLHPSISGREKAKILLDINVRIITHKGLSCEVDNLFYFFLISGKHFLLAGSGLQINQTLPMWQKDLLVCQLFH